MSRAVMMSLNPQWFGPIMNGIKTREVRKRAPLQRHPYKVYLYCTKGGEQVYRPGVRGKFPAYRMNGTVCGEFVCVSTMELNPPWSHHLLGTGLSAAELCRYAGGADRLCYMAISNPVLYEKPKRLEDFGLTMAPLSWQYIDEEDEPG